MLIDSAVNLALALVPVLLSLPWVFVVLRHQVSYVPRARLQRRLYRNLLLAEKLPAQTLGSRQIERDIDRLTLRVGYLAQYPQRSRETAEITLIGTGLLAVIAAYYALWLTGASLVVLAIIALLMALAAAVLTRTVHNFARNDGLVFGLFEQFGAPTELLRPRTELVAQAPLLTVDTVLNRAADVRDAGHGSSMTTLAAVNMVLTQAYSHLHWRTEIRRLARRVRTVDYRGHAGEASTRGLGIASTSYQWLLRHLVGPFFALRLGWLHQVERYRTDRAGRSGDVFKSAWLAAHYRNERRRLAGHWAAAQRVDPRWARP